jgi:hypothetical protein
MVAKGELEDFFHKGFSNLPVWMVSIYLSYLTVFMGFVVIYVCVKSEWLQKAFCTIVGQNITFL